MQKMCFPSAGRAPHQQPGLGPCAGDDAREDGHQLGVAANKKIGKPRRLGIRQLEDKLFQDQR
jgi:hypothetical protein